MEANMYTREQLLEQLKQKTLQVTFTKVNGDQRVMTCTLQESVLPPAPVTQSTTERKSNDATISVWDVNAAGWRSFRVDNVTDVADAE
jgi:hypothetical protein